MTRRRRVGAPVRQGAPASFASQAAGQSSEMAHRDVAPDIEDRTRAVQLFTGDGYCRTTRPARRSPPLSRGSRWPRPSWVTGPIRLSRANVLLAFGLRSGPKQTEAIRDPIVCSAQIQRAVELDVLHDAIRACFVVLLEHPRELARAVAGSQVHIATRGTALTTSTTVGAVAPRCSPQRWSDGYLMSDNRTE